MNAQWEWLILQVFVTSCVGFFWIRRVGKGRLLSRPLWRFRFFRPYVSFFTGEVYAANVRMGQVVVLLAIWFPLIFTVGHVPNFFSPILVALYLDDYLTGDDDRWKRFKEWAKNKVRWKATKPAPARVGA